MSKLNNQGITLLEVLITISIILIGILVLTKIFPLALSVNRTAEQSTVATDLAQAKAEEMFSFNYDDLTIGTFEAKHRLSADSADLLYHYQRSTVIEYVDQNLQTSAAPTDLKKVTITVYWQNLLLAAEKNEQLTILITRK